MEPFVIKRNGEYKLFEEFKIKDAIQKAFESVCGVYLISSKGKSGVKVALLYMGWNGVIILSCFN